MLKFIRGKGQQPTAERQKLQKELFAYRKTVQHGFPHKPSAMAYDPKLKLMAIGTYSGAIKVFGRPGVEFYGQHSSTTGNASDCTVQLLEWIPGTGRILSLTASNQLILWEPAGAMLVPIKSLLFDGKLKNVSSICCSQSKDVVWIGTELGNVYQLDLKSFATKEPVIYHDVVTEQVPNYKLSPGAIESVKQLPNDWNHLLIAYNRGLCVLWDTDNNSVLKAYIAPGHGQTVGLYVHANGLQFTWYHADGSYATWDIIKTDPPKNENYVPYGPDPCKSINSLVYGKRGEKDDLFIFSGGMPRSAYGDHNCVSVHCTDGTKLCLDFTSKVIDFFVAFNESDHRQAEVLIVLLEEELCAYDLTDPTLPVVKAPYLHSLHASAVTCNQLASQVTKEVYEKIIKAGDEQDTELSDIDWPISGGDLPDDNTDEDLREYEVLLTGHEDGSVRFWDCTGVVLKPIFHIKTAKLFGHSELDETLENSEPLDDSEPPFRKAGLFDPYSDDPRLAVKKIALCSKTGRLVIAGTAGHIVIASFDHSMEDGPLKVTTMNLVGDRDGFVWKGHDQLKVRPQYLEEDAEPVEISGVQVHGVLQVLPPAGITCVALQTDWHLLAAGTAHGLVLFDYQNNHPVYHRCTLNPNDLTGAGEQFSRRKSFKKTLRESFRRLRKSKSTRNNPTNATQVHTLDNRPIERQVEARPVDDGMGSMVKCLLFAKTYITNIHTTTPTLWSATNSSCVSVLVLYIPPNQPAEGGDNISVQKRMITAEPAKEIQIKHRAPVVGISIFDHAGVPLELNGPGTSPHRVLIATEEQFKVYSLPQLKPVTKYKLTAHEGARVRKLAFAMFTCRVPPELMQSSPTKRPQAESPHSDASAGDVGSDGGQLHTEVGILCLTNLGDCLVLSIPELKRQLNAAAVRREDISGISSLCFTNYGEALYMMSSSEIQRISLSATKVCTPEGVVSTEALQEKDSDAASGNEQDTLEVASTDSGTITKDVNHPLGRIIDTTSSNAENLTNGVDASPNRANETITSSMGDITVDSVRDLNSTVTTLCSQITEETVGRLSVISTQTQNTVTSVNMKDIPDFNMPNLKDLAPLGNTTETNTKSVVIKSIITNISHGATNGETETVTTKSTTRKESQF